MALPAPDASSTSLVTGASSGIGEELARGLARRGHNLTLVARREEKLKGLADELQRTTGIEAVAVRCDLSDAQERGELVEGLKAREREVSVLVNCAGLGTGGFFTDLDREAESRMIRVNVEALVDLCHVYAPAMGTRGKGAIVNVASIAGYAPIPRQSTYAATKAFVISFSHALHAEMRHAGVTVTTLCPGPTDTEFSDASGSRVASAMESLPAFMVSHAAEVAEAGLRGVEEGRRHVTVGMLNKASALSAYLTPRALELAAFDRFYPVRG
jgi:short-subunit dehydrogenase